MSRILVTGATGFIGRHLCRSLATIGEMPVAAVREPSGMFEEERVTGDLAELPDLSGFLADIDTVVHLAGLAHLIRAAADDCEDAFRRANVDAAVHLARAAAAAGVRRLVFLSTIKVNGETTTDRPFCETDPPNPHDAYARSKLAAEQALHRIATETDLEVVVIRPPLVYGPGVKANFLRLLQLVERGVPLPLGAIRNRRSLISLDNLSSLIHAAIRHPAAAGEVFLASDQCDCATPELVRMLAAGLGRTARLYPVAPPLLATCAKLVGREATYHRIAGSLQVDSSKASRLLGWRPAVSPAAALRETANWYRAITTKPSRSIAP
jgi:nucleoside-diphosphate-sugar epimerase